MSVVLRAGDLGAEHVGKLVEVQRWTGRMIGYLLALETSANDQGIRLSIGGMRVDCPPETRIEVHDDVK